MDFEIPKTQSVPEEPKGEIVCAYCKKVIGVFAGQGNSHGICPECRAGVVEQELQELKSLVSKEKNNG
jgi:hypothetical protein